MVPGIVELFLTILQILAIYRHNCTTTNEHHMIQQNPGGSSVAHGVGEIGVASVVLVVSDFLKACYWGEDHSRNNANKFSYGKRAYMVSPLYTLHENDLEHVCHFKALRKVGAW